MRRTMLELKLLLQYTVKSKCKYANYLYNTNPDAYSVPFITILSVNNKQISYRGLLLDSL